MRTALMHKLHDHLQANYPDVLLPLQEQQQVTDFLEKEISQVDELLTALLDQRLPAYEVEALCMQTITDQLPSSKFNYIVRVLSDEFEATHTDLQSNGILVYEVLNILDYCKPVFEATPLTKDNEEDRLLRYAVTGSIAAYLQQS